MVKRAGFSNVERRQLLDSMRGTPPNHREQVYQEIMTMEELAHYLRMNIKTCYAAAKTGDIPAFKIGDCWRAKKSVVDAWIESAMRRTDWR